jgi:hypothetical protein
MNDLQLYMQEVIFDDQSEEYYTTKVKGIENRFADFKKAHEKVSNICLNSQS